MTNDQAVQVEKLVKVYPGDIRAVSEIDFSVDQGEFVGFLGPNGAGKSTTMKVLSSLLKKTSGHVVVGGYDVDTDAMAVRESIGFAMQEVGLDDLAKGRDFLVMQGLLYGQSRQEARDRAEELLELMGLTAAANRRIGTDSGGMRRRIDLIGALVHRPPLLFLDEPTTGLDPQSRLAIWDHLEQLNKDGTTIFLTTQMMEEADHLCQRIYIIDNGEIVAEGSPEGLKDEVGEDVITVAIGSASEEQFSDQTAKAETALRERPYVTDVNTLDGSLSISARDGGASVPDLLRLLSEIDVTVTNLSIASPTLDDVFLKYTGRTIRSEEAAGGDLDQMMRQFTGLGRR